MPTELSQADREKFTAAYAKRKKVEPSEARKMIFDAGVGRLKTLAKSQAKTGGAPKKAKPAKPAKAAKKAAAKSKTAKRPAKKAGRKKAARKGGGKAPAAAASAGSAPAAAVAEGEES